MNLDDFIIPPRAFKSESWQVGSLIQNELVENGIALVFASDYRGARGEAEIQNFTTFRKYFYKLSKLDFELPICDLGDLISGKSHEDTHYALQEVVSACLYKNTIPVIIGGSSDLAYSLFYALNFHQQNIRYTQISNVVSLGDEGEGINEKNFLNKIFSTKNFSLRDFHLLGYQKHLNEVDSVKLIKEVEFDIIRLAEMMGSTHKMEPFFRGADLVTLNCDAIESFQEPFSIHPQVNGLNRREICAYMQEIGLGENLKTFGLFNFNFDADSVLNHQLLAQMIWYLVEGINIQKSHPKERSYETFVVMVNDSLYSFKRDTFSNLWYFGEGEAKEDWVACSSDDYEQAKRGILNPRLK